MLMMMIIIMAMVRIDLRKETTTVIVITVTVTMYMYKYPFCCVASLKRLTGEDVSCIGDPCHHVLYRNGSTADCEVPPSEELTFDMRDDQEPVFTLVRLWLTVPERCGTVDISAIVTLSVQFDSEETKEVRPSYVQ